MNLFKSNRLVFIWVAKVAMVLLWSCSSDDVPIETWEVIDSKDMSRNDNNSSLMDLQFAEEDITPPPLADARKDVDFSDSGSLKNAERRSCNMSDVSKSCRTQRTDSFGECGLDLGAVFNGTECVPVTGCECTGEECPDFGSVSQCAKTCGIEGWCQTDKFNHTSTTPNQSPPCDGFFCGSVLAVCMDSEENPALQLSVVAPELGPFSSCERAGRSYCSLIGPCQDPQWCCYKEMFGMPILDSVSSDEICSVSLLSSSKDVSCASFE